jgi:hypothetical protein
MKDHSRLQKLLNLPHELQGFGTTQKIPKYTHHSHERRPQTSCDLETLSRSGDQIRIHYFLIFPGRSLAEEVMDIPAFGMTLSEHTVIVMTTRVKAHGQLNEVHPILRQLEKCFMVVASPRRLDVFNQLSRWRPRPQYSKTQHNPNGQPRDRGETKIGHPPPV